MALLPIDQFWPTLFTRLQSSQYFTEKIASCQWNSRFNNFYQVHPVTLCNYDWKDFSRHSCRLVGEHSVDVLSPQVTERYYANLGQPLPVTGETVVALVHTFWPSVPTSQRISDQLDRYVPTVLKALIQKYLEPYHPVTRLVLQKLNHLWRKHQRLRTRLGLPDSGLNRRPPVFLRRSQRLQRRTKARPALPEGEALRRRKRRRVHLPKP